MDTLYRLLEWNPVQVGSTFQGGGSELSDQLLDPDVPTLASQDKLKVSPKGLPFVITPKTFIRLKCLVSIKSWPSSAPLFSAHKIGAVATA